MEILLYVFAMMFSSACYAHPMEETIYMRKSQIEDQDASATGYSYQTYSGQPQHQLFGYPPITLGRYTQELPVVQLPLAEGNLAGHQFNALPLNSYGLPVNPAALAAPRIAPLPAPVLPLELNKYTGGNEAERSSFAKGGGSNYGAESATAKGAKDSSGYKTSEKFAKGAQGKHENEQNKGYYGQEGGNKASHHDAGAHYDKKEEAAKSTKGGSFRQKSGHKKGSKTTGYHRVHHTDEYKKDHSFYDESDRSGNFHKHGNFDAKEAAEKGAFQKGGHQDSAFNAGQSGQQRFQDNGKYLDQDSGYHGSAGNEAHHRDANNYAKKGGHEQHQQQGFSQNKGEQYHQGY